MGGELGVEVLEAQAFRTPGDERFHLAQKLLAVMLDLRSHGGRRAVGGEQDQPPGIRVAVNRIQHGFEAVGEYLAGVAP